MSFWHRPLHAMTQGGSLMAAIRNAGCGEGTPPRAMRRELLPDIMADIPSAFLCFLFFVLEAGMPCSS